jgi:hypothetical protein
MTALARYRGSRTQFQIAYTWSHSIDNQDESLAGEFDFTQLNRGDIGLKGISAFSRQFDPASDRGNSDFDQRHNLVFYLIWESPSFPASRFARLIRDWKLSTLGAFRSGFPYTVSAPAQFSFTGESIANNRADIVNPLSTTSNLSYPGGRVLLNLGGFSEPLPGTLGNSGRNAFRGPGFYSVDLSAARSIPVRRLGEGGRLVLRADAINVLNHANLNTPVADVGSPDTFGVALYGRQEQNRGFPLLTPLRESGRQIQLLLRIEF